MSGPKNVVVVVVDALRADRVGISRGGRSLTPNIDSLGEEGTLFENAFSCASNTDPSITSLLTGRYPLNTVYHHGKLVTDQEKRRVESVPPLPTLLSDAGWETAAVGQALDRWHSQGFDQYPGAGSETRVRSTAMGIARRAFDTVNDVSPRIGSAIRSLYNVSNRGMKPDVVMQDYDPTTLVSRIGSRPFFGFVHLMETHMPYLGTTEDFDELSALGDYPEEPFEVFFADRDLTDAQIERVENALDSLGLDHPGELRVLYDAAVRYADRKVGRLVDELQQAGYWEDTALFVTADHGESLFEHGIFLDHHGLYDEVFRVPLVSDLGDGRQIEELVQLIDVAPTILELLGVNAPEMDGKSLRPLIDGIDSWDSRSAVFAEEAYTQRRIGIRTRRWKHLRHVQDDVIEEERGSSLECGYCETVHGAERELFDLESDPVESENVIDDHSDIVERLEQRYESFTSDLVEPGDADGEIRYEHEEEVLDRLEAIGYR